MAVKELHNDRKGAISFDRVEEDANALVNEITLMQRFHHENIVRYLGAETRMVDASDQSQASLSAGTGARTVLIFSEWMPGGSVEGIVARFGRLSESTIKVYTEQILAGLAYLHTQRVVHNDIKGANVRAEWSC